MDKRFLILALTALLSGCKKDPPVQAPKLDAYEVGNGGGGAAQSVRGAVARTVKLNDLDQLKLYIEVLAGESDRFPTADTVRASLKGDLQMGSLWKLIENGSIVLGPMGKREGIWAYEKLALTDGGIVLSNGGVERMAPGDLEAKLNGR